MDVITYAWPNLWWLIGSSWLTNETTSKWAPLPMWNNSIVIVIQYCDHRYITLPCSLRHWRACRGNGSCLSNHMSDISSPPRLTVIYGDMWCALLSWQATNTITSSNVVTQNWIVWCLCLKKQTDRAMSASPMTLRWRHNERDCVSNHQPHDCFLNCLFRRRSKKTSKLRVTGLCAGNSPGTGEFPAQMASNAENVSIWWRHHVQDHSCKEHVSKLTICIFNSKREYNKYNQI